MLPAYRPTNPGMQPAWLVAAHSPAHHRPCRSDHFSWGEIAGAARPSSAGGFLHVEHQVSLKQTHRC